METVTTKECRRCKVEKPIDAFGKWATMRDGHNYYCKVCAVICSGISRAKSKAARAESRNDTAAGEDAGGSRRFELKKCHKCGMTKMRCCFSKCSQSSDGKFSRCKVCEKERRDRRKC